MIIVGTHRKHLAKAKYPGSRVVYAPEFRSKGPRFESHYHGGGIQTLRFTSEHRTELEESLAFFCLDMT